MVRRHKFHEKLSVKRQTNIQNMKNRESLNIMRKSCIKYTSKKRYTHDIHQREDKRQSVDIKNTHEIQPQETKDTSSCAKLLRYAFPRPALDTKAASSLFLIVITTPPPPASAGENTNTNTYTNTNTCCSAGQVGGLPSGSHRLPERTEASVGRGSWRGFVFERILGFRHGWVYSYLVGKGGALDRGG